MLNNLKLREQRGVFGLLSIRTVLHAEKNFNLILKIHFTCLWIALTFCRMN
jgi:hypothetical protein